MKIMGKSSYPTRSRISASILASLSAILLTPAHSEPAATGAEAGIGTIQLGRNLRGREIPSVLAARLGELSAAYGKSPEQLQQLCERNPTLRADKRGRLFYSCEGLLPLQNAVAKADTASGGTTLAGAYPADQTFLLHSRPGAQRVIYLDFNGHTTSGTPWNSNFTSGANIVTPPYDSDGVPSSFSTTELDTIQAIWQRVAEDYAPFELDVTTEEPGIEALRKSSSTDTAYGVRVCIGGSSYDWYGAGAGGVAYLGSFSWSTDSPAFVFPVQLGNGNNKYTAEAASHEAGHTFGLYHDGTTAGVEYYQGHDTWAPIMGVSYYKTTSQWSKGEYAAANNTEDDVAIIAQNAPYRTDAHGDAITNATSLVAPWDYGSVIERRTDADLFRFACGAGTVSFTTFVASPSPNVKTQLSLYDGNGSLVTFATGTGMSSTLEATVAQGTYYIGVDGVGTGAPDVGYNDYGSLGQYRLVGNAPPVNSQAPVAVADNSAPLVGAPPLAVSFSSAGSHDPDGSIVSYDWDFGDGTTSTEPNPVHIYSVAGTYHASLIVKDNTGLSGSDSVTVLVQENKVVYVASITMTKNTTARGTAATATVTVKDHTGALKSGAKVTGQWSGLVSGTTSKNTNTAGNAIFTSSRVKGAGLFTFTVTGITLSGYTYAPSKNIESQDSIAP